MVKIDCQGLTDADVSANHAAGHVCGDNVDILGPKLHTTFYVVTSVTRLGDLLDFGQLFTAFCNN